MGIKIGKKSRGDGEPVSLFSTKVLIEDFGNWRKRDQDKIRNELTKRGIDIDAELNKQ